VRLSQEHDKQSSEVELMTDKHKKVRVEAEISRQVTETTDVERQIRRLCLHVLRHKELGNETNLQRDNQLLENQFTAELKVTGTTELLLLLPPANYNMATCGRTGGFCQSLKWHALAGGGGLSQARPRRQKPEAATSGRRAMMT